MFTHIHIMNIADIPLEVWVWFGDNVLVCKLRAVCAALSRLMPLELEWTTNETSMTLKRGAYGECVNILHNRMFMFGSHHVSSVDLRKITDGVFYRGEYYNVSAAEFRYGLAAIFGGDVTNMRAVKLISKWCNSVWLAPEIQVAGVTMYYDSKHRYNYLLYTKCWATEFHTRMCAREYSCDYPPDTFAESDIGVWLGEDV
jgi:hypothetical protein